MMNTPPKPLGTRVARMSAALALALATMPLLALPAYAHVKWFAPYIVGAAPQPIGTTLANLWFWLGIGLVLAFFLATRAIERAPVGESILKGMDFVSAPLNRRLDDFVLCVIGAFFVAIFAVGGVYLTPDLQTPAEWVSWLQLLIAFGVFSKRTRVFSAAGIILLWALALRDYDIFHLLDYLALGVAVAGYLVLEASNNPDWRKHRFEVLRWGVAIALMWSSLEKFAYPEWFFPLVLEKPFLTFGLPRDVFIPMAGVAEFTMGFGLLFTPLIRRLSAVALFIIFNAAVYPFGRIDLIGHALIMAIIVAIAADPVREIHFLPKLKRYLAAVPVGLAAALVIVSGSYWGLHAVFYGPSGTLPSNTATMATHVADPERPHTAAATMAGNVDNAAAIVAAYEDTMTRMHGQMMEAMMNPDPDAAFILGMIPHHQGAIDMANVILQYGDNDEAKVLARHIIADQQMEIRQMEQWVAAQSNVEPALP